MTEQPLDYYLLVNLAIGLGATSMAIAFCLGLYRNSVQYRSLAGFLIAFLAAVSCTRFIRVFGTATVPGSTEMLSDFAVAVTAVLAGAAIWPLLLNQISKPNYHQVEAANQRLQYYKSLFETFMYNNPAVTFLQDSGLNVIYVNRAFEIAFGTTLAEINGSQTFLGSSGEPDTDMSKHDRTVISSNKPMSKVYYLDIGNLKNEPWLIMKFPLHGTKPGEAALGGIGVSLGERERSEAEIDELNSQLQRRISELNETNMALEMARDQALESSNLKSAFCANISHELRTPLSGIIGLNEMLVEQSSLPDEQHQLAVMVQESAEALLHVVNDILDLSKIEAGRVTMEYAEFDPVALLNDCCKLMAPTALKKKLEYVTDIDPEIPFILYGDESRIRQVLLNLIGNAIKFTDRGSVRIRATTVDVTDESAVLEVYVEDTGIGIARQDQRLLFVPFAQVDNGSTRKFGGTGLGLTISKRFIEMMGGLLSLSSEAGVGSTFWFRVELDKKNLQKSQGSGAQKGPKPGVKPVPASLSVGKKILLVEDNRVLQHLALRQLASLGLDADAVATGRSAIEKANSNTYDLVLMDINLPDVNGLEATVSIRNTEKALRRAPIPIIAMTAGAMVGDRDRALAAGMDDYLAKPVSVESLRDTIASWLEFTATRKFVPHSAPHNPSISTNIPPV